MDHRTLTLVIISATGLKKPTFNSKTDVYAVASISGTNQKQRTPIHKHGDSDPTWNFPMKFVINEAAGLQNHLTLIIKIKAVGLFGGRSLGEVHVPVKDLLEGVTAEGKTMQSVSYQVMKASGKPKGVLRFSYEFGEKFKVKREEPVTAYPSASYVATGGYGYPQQQPGYGYYPPAMQGYGGYAPPPVVQQPRRSRMGGSGMGFGTGLMGGALGGLLLGDIMSGHGGGGCGGGGCGGGCGGCGGGCGGF